MSTVTPLISNQKIPKFVRVKQYFEHNELSEAEVVDIIRNNFSKPEFCRLIKPGMRVCITAGSRGLSNIVIATKTVVECVKELGGSPFIIPAMGSHGGATAEGQLGILKSYDITEENMGCPIISSMETVKIGHAPEIDEDVQIDKNAYGADGIIVMNRIKPHTGFKGRYESGLMKMMTIGLGKQAGAYVAHSQGNEHMPERIFSIGSEIIRKAPILMGIGLMENAFDKTYRIEFVEAEKIPEKEPELLNDAKAHMGRIYLDACDVIILEKIGKNYSGGGMDPNVVGRSELPIGIKSERMGIWGLSEESHGNATGMGRADVATMDFFKQVSFNDTYPNAVTDHNSSCYKLPLIMDNEKECLQACMAICLKMDPENPRIIILKNSLEIESMLISEALIPEARKHPELIIETESFELEFDENGRLYTKY